VDEQVLLKLEGIHKSFSGIEVLHGVSLDLRKGEVLGLVGENGAGKSTLMSIIGGLYGFDSGTMTIGGDEYRPQNPTDARNMGIAFVHQEFSLFTNLSVADNLFVDRYPHNALYKINRRRITEQTVEYLELFKLDVSPKAKIETLSMGIRQIIEISKALAKHPKILIFDEPTTSLSPKEKDRLFEVIQKQRESQVSIIYISHILDDVIQLCDRMVILRDGQTVGRMDKKEFDKKAIIKLMVGREMNQGYYPAVEKEIGDPVYEVNDFVRGGGEHSVSFVIKKGEVVGLFGLMGAGRTELLNSLFGVEPNEGGGILLGGKRLGKPLPEKCIKNGIAYITENRRQEGLLVVKSVGMNLVMVILRKLLRKMKVVDQKREKQAVYDLVKRFSIKTADPEEQEAKKLSGGNQQKLVVAKWYASEPKILFMDEPTRGVDVGAKYEIYTYINQLAKDGCGVFMVSSEMEELMGMCDRILVMYRGRIVADIPRSDYSGELIIQYALEGRVEHAG
jgi:ribose transport system ATP-binding protein